MEYFTSLFDSVKNRLTNPFLGTLILVWIIRNWLLVYSLFNFDPDTKIDDKLNFINTYLNKQSLVLEVFINVGIAFAIMLVTYLLLAISKFAVEFYHKKVIRNIVVYIDKTAILTKAEAQILENQIKQCADIIKIKTEQISDQQSDITSLQHIKSDLSSTLSELNTEKSKLIVNYEVCKIDLNDKVEIIETLLTQNIKQFSNTYELFQKMNSLANLPDNEFNRNLLTKIMEDSGLSFMSSNLELSVFLSAYMDIKLFDTFNSALDNNVWILLKDHLPGDLVDMIDLNLDSKSLEYMYEQRLLSRNKKGSFLTLLGHAFVKSWYFKK